MAGWFQRKRESTKTQRITRNMKGFIVVSPWAWLLINVLGLTMVFIIYGDQTYLTPLDVNFYVFLALNGFLLAYILMTYLFRDGSKKFVSASISASLGPNDGLPVFISSDPERKYPEMILMNLEGFNTKVYDVHSMGRCIAIFPTYLCNVFPGGGIEANCYLKRTPLDRLPKHIQEYLSLRLEGDRGKMAMIWYGIKPYYDLSDRGRRLNVNYLLRFAQLKARRLELKDGNADLATKIDALNKSTMKIKMYDKMGTPNTPTPQMGFDEISPQVAPEPQRNNNPQNSGGVDPRYDSKGRLWKFP